MSDPVQEWREHFNGMSIDTFIFNAKSAAEPGIPGQWRRACLLAAIDRLEELLERNRRAAAELERLLPPGHR